jgi:amidohydrolase
MRSWVVPCVLSFVSLCRCATAKPAAITAADVAPVMDEVRADFEEFHRHPELGKQEIETSRRVRARLRAVGFTRFEDIPALPTAVVAVLDTGRPGPTIALRSELDARPGDETTGLPYASTVKGVMHSCGHDAHAAILLGAARVLFARRSALRGRVVFVFQPAEETPGGADDIVADGVLDRLHVKAIFALHSAPGLAVGKVELTAGPVLAGSTYFTGHVHGAGSHAAAPFEGDDVVASAARIVDRLVDLPARHLDGIAHPAVISVTALAAGDVKAANVLPTDAELRGTVRSFDDLEKTAVTAAGATLEGLIASQVSGWATALHVTATLEWRRGSPPTVNDPALAARLTPALRDAWGKGDLGEQPRAMFSEDFAFYTSGRPALYVSLGVAKGDLGKQPVHTNAFSVHPDALEAGVRWTALVADVALRSLQDG